MLPSCVAVSATPLSHGEAFAQTRWGSEVRVRSLLARYSITNKCTETVMMLANMINGKPDKKDKGPKTTLIVANNALVDQWFAEIPKHCGPKAFSVLQWTAKTKLHTNDNVSIIEKHDVV